MSAILKCIKQKYTNLLDHYDKLTMSEFDYLSKGDNAGVEQNVQCLYVEPAVSLARRRIVYHVDQLQNTGGLCDRLKGIVSLYVLAQRLDMDFKINICYPFRLEDYLEPNEYDWVMAEPLVRAVNALPYRLRSHIRRSRCQAHSEEEMHYDEQKLRKLITNNPQIDDFHICTNVYFGNPSFCQSFKTLFKPNSRILSKIDQYLPNGEAYISLSFRFIGILGDFADSEPQTLLSESEKQQYLSDSLALIESVYLQHRDTVSRIFIATDSPTLLTEASKFEFVFTVPGAIAHSALPAEDFDKEFVDFFLISKAQESYLCKKEKMYMSGFAQTASMAGGKSCEVLYY